MVNQRARFIKDHIRVERGPIRDKRKIKVHCFQNEGIEPDDDFKDFNE
jgi:hypothetical protein